MFKITPEWENNNLKLPILEYLGYLITKFFDFFKPISFLLDKVETLMLQNDITRLNIDKPIYITGLARAGTTIILEMLSKHPDLASHQYKHVLMPYLPFWLPYLIKNTGIYVKPIERIHKDGIMITRDSPEAVEEVFWRKFFNDTHNETISNIIRGNVCNPKFERFYKNHIAKLLLSQNRSRYLAKNNYNITRLEYLLKIFPNSKFLLLIRNPINHIASLIKQTKLLITLEQQIPFLHDWMLMVGHQEFGHHQVCINVDNTELIHKIRKLWRNQETYVKGWAYYWDSVYNFIADQLDINKKLKSATLIIDYDKLCETPAKKIDEILDHIEISTVNFKETRNYYITNLHKPTYYTPDFSEKELAQISEVTKLTAARFGINSLI